MSIPDYAVLVTVGTVAFLHFPMRQIRPKIKPLSDKEFFKLFFMRHCTVGDVHVQTPKMREYAEKYTYTVLHFNK